MQHVGIVAGAVSPPIEGNLGGGATPEHVFSPPGPVVACSLDTLLWAGTVRAGVAGDVMVRQVLRMQFGGLPELTLHAERTQAILRTVIVYESQERQFFAIRPTSRSLANTTGAGLARSTTDTITALRGAVVSWLPVCLIGCSAYTA